MQKGQYALSPTFPEDAFELKKTIYAQKTNSLPHRKVFLDGLGRKIRILSLKQGGVMSI